ncbi:MAG: response regulator [Magnetococcus sp. WYHC-3]
MLEDTQFPYRVLVADDEEAIRGAFLDILEPAHRESRRLAAFLEAEVQQPTPPGAVSFSVSLAAGGDEAVGLARAALDAGRPFQLAFLDMRMPPGMDGLKTALALRAVDARVQIVMVTAYSDHSVDDMHLALEHDFILARKPLTRDEILQLARNGCQRWTADLSQCRIQAGLQDRVEDLSRLRLYLTDMVDAIPAAILIANTNGHLRFGNYAARVMLGATTPLHGRLLTQVFPGDMVSRLVRAMVDHNAKPRGVSMTLCQEDGTLLPVWLSGSVLSDPRGQVHSVLLLIQGDRGGGA